VILQKNSGRIGVDKILLGRGTEGFIQDEELSASITLANSNLSPPVATYQPAPPYTPQAQRDQVEGDVDLAIIIDAEGNVAEAREISKPLGDGLDEKAIETVKTWKFKPATRNGVPVPTRVTVMVSFRLYRQER
jgi:TonB family protein